jgi:hypothetical protein
LFRGGVAIRKIARILIVVIACLGGCPDSDKVGSSGADNAEGLDICAAMIEHLENENLPALESVEVWQNEYGPGLRLTTAHYEVLTTVLEPLMLRRIPGFIESAYRGYNSQLPQPIETKSKFTVYLFAERTQWEDFTKVFAGHRAELFCKIKAGAYYLNGACVTHNIGRKRTFAALGHEGWHQFNSRHFKFRLPSWLDEGIAMLFEASRCEDGIFYFEPDENVHRLDALRKMLQENKRIPLRELTAINPGEVLAIDQDEAVTAFYSQSYALVRFLREGGYGKRLGSFRRLLFDGLRGNWPLSKASKKVAADRNIPRTVAWNRVVGPQLFKQYISDDFDQIEREYLAFCRQIVSY